MGVAFLEDDGLFDEGARTALKGRRGLEATESLSNCAAKLEIIPGFIVTECML
jgi:hypothetical protein